MSITRRLLLGSTAAVGLVAAGAGTFALTRTPGDALAPWRAANLEISDRRLAALSYAVLAPNPHNRQPWLLRLDGSETVMLSCDPDRLLPETDPFGRQILIGLGCFVETFRIAASVLGSTLRADYFPQGAWGEYPDGRPVARLTLAEGGTRDPLFAQVPNRRSTKEPFDMSRTVAPGIAEDIVAAGRGQATLAAADVSGPKIELLRDLTWRGHEVESVTERTFMESVRLMRIGKAEINASPDGIDLGGPFLEALNIAGVLTRETLADPNSEAFAQGLDTYREMLGSAMGYVWVTTAGNSRIEQIEAGRAWVRINLKATELDVAIHPISQTLQEYSEMASLYEDVHGALAGQTGARVQMLARIGYGPTVDPSPRWPVEARLAGA